MEQTDLSIKWNLKKVEIMREAIQNEKTFENLKANNLNKTFEKKSGCKLSLSQKQQSKWLKDRIQRKGKFESNSRTASKPFWTPETHGKIIQTNI